MVVLPTFVDFAIVFAVVALLPADGEFSLFLLQPTPVNINIAISITAHALIQCLLPILITPLYNIVVALNINKHLL
jgi:ABC-type transport system involved in cytochrome c biogenesis permease component